MTQDPFLTDRFEFFIAGRELANGFSELNDPEDQAARFQRAGRAQGQGRRGGHVLRRRLRARAGIRHAADGGPGLASIASSCSSPIHPRSAT
jgi:elongation factor P--beta-lysine ligase